MSSTEQAVTQKFNNANSDINVKSTGYMDQETAVTETQGWWFCFQQIPKSILLKVGFTLLQNSLHFLEIL